jgi:hypothetical protein
MGWILKEEEEREEILGGREEDRLGDKGRR